VLKPVQIVILQRKKIQIVARILVAGFRFVAFTVLVVAYVSFRYVRFCIFHPPCQRKNA